MQIQNHSPHTKIATTTETIGVEDEEVDHITEEDAEEDDIMEIETRQELCDIAVTSMDTMPQIVLIVS